MIEMAAPNYTFRSLWRSPILPLTGFCKGLYKLVPYNNGFICRYSDDFKTLDLNPVRNSQKFEH